MLIPTHFWKCYVSKFLLSSWSLWIMSVRQVYYTSQYKIVVILPFFLNICYLSTWYKIHWCNTVLKARAILHVCSKITSFFSYSLWWICYRCVVYFKVGWCGKSHQESMKVCDLAHCVTFLWCRNSRGEAFVRSFVSCYPEGFCAPYFFCSKSPGYTSVISLLHSPPSQIEDTIDID